MELSTVYNRLSFARPEFLKRLAASLLRCGTWVVLLAIVAQWIVLRWFGDSTWFGTIILFAPRWPLWIPFAAITLLCLIFQRRLLWVNFLSAILLAGPTMGFNWPTSFVRPAGAFQLRIMTANIGDGVNVDLLRSQIELAQPDVITFQECPSRILEVLAENDWKWQSARALLVGSRYPILQTARFEGSRVGRYHDNGLRVQLETPAGKIWVCCIYLDSPRNGFESLYLSRRGLSGIDELRRNIYHRSELSRQVSSWVSEADGPTIVAGDMNQPPESYFQRRDWSNWQDAYATVGLGYGHTWFSSWHGLRIDHVLFDNHWSAKSCQVAGITGGDHRPLVADLVVNPAQN